MESLIYYQEICKQLPNNEELQYPVEQKKIIIKKKKNLLRLLHMGMISSYSTMNITEVMITAARMGLGMYASDGMRKANASITNMPNQ